LALKTANSTVRKAKHETGRDSWQASLSLLGEQHSIDMMPSSRGAGEARATTVMQCGTMQVLDMIQDWVERHLHQRQHSGNNHWA